MAMPHEHDHEHEHQHARRNAVAQPQMIETWTMEHGIISFRLIIIKN